MQLHGTCLSSMQKALNFIDSQPRKHNQLLKSHSLWQKVNTEMDNLNAKSSTAPEGFYLFICFSLYMCTCAYLCMCVCVCACVCRSVNTGICVTWHACGSQRTSSSMSLSSWWNDISCLSFHVWGYVAQELPGILLSVFYLAYNWL